MYKVELTLPLSKKRQVNNLNTSLNALIRFVGMNTSSSVVFKLYPKAWILQSIRMVDSTF